MTTLGFEEGPLLDQFTKDFPALAGRIGKRNLPTLLAGARQERVPAGTTLIRDQWVIEDLFLVAEGVCHVSVEAEGRILQLGRLGKGQWLGEISLLTGGAATSSVTAETDVRVVAWPVGEIHKLREESPEVASVLARELIDVLMERIRASDAELHEKEGGLALAGSDVVREKHEAPPRRGWLRRALEKLTGASDAGGER